MVTVSAIYFFADQRRPAYADRLISSAHGIVGVLLYFGALAIWWSSPNEARPFLANPYAFLYLVPLGLIGVSLFRFRGPRFIHLLQLPNLAALAWALFVGSMAVSGDWL
ncbi:MAG TPA: hypothetical protein VGK37_17195 [Casimicrobiaceae bacterium]|jgi:hypothetical protein